MAVTRVGIVLMLLALSGCAAEVPALQSPPTQRLSYEPPVAVDRGQDPVILPGSLAPTWLALSDALERSPLQIVHADPVDAVVVATYSGAPEPLLDCGLLLVETGDGVKQVPAARSEMQLDRQLDGQTESVTRKLQLDARIVFELRPIGAQTELSSASTYVLTRTLQVLDEAGQPREQGREVIRFSDSGRAEFDKGTLCLPTGALQTTVTEALRAPRLSRSGAAAPGPTPGAVGERGASRVPIR